ncbi:hypothetical protein GCM10009846_25840 [Agrococcus versicolor]|uniref:DUF3093 domain-containing protein n=1 Tax=Agrococcus versicolor TaxID=501482 RepID=A0ABP5MRX8_9MICO
MMSRAWFALAALSVLVVPVALLLPVEPAVRWAMLGYAVVVMTLGIVMGLRVRRREAPADLVPVAPATVPDALPRPWPRDAFAAALAAAFAPTPFRVQAAPDRLRVVVDERDPRYVGSVEHWRPPVVLHWDLWIAHDAVVLRPGIDGLAWTAPGVPPQRTGRAVPVSRRTWSILEAQHASAVHPQHPWRWIAADVRPTIEAVAARAGLSVRQGVGG